MKRYLFNFLMFAVLALVGCQETSRNQGNSIPLGQFSSVQNIKDYLKTNVASTGFGGKPYCAYEVLDAQQEGKNINIYLWTLCQEYYLGNQKLRQGTGSVFPVALIMKINGNNLSVLDHRVPRNGALYAEDMPIIFSERFRTKIQAETTVDQNNRVNRLQSEVQREAGVN